MTLPTTMQIRKAIRKASRKTGISVTGVQTYTDKRSGNTSRVAFLTYHLSEDRAAKLAKKANKILKKKGLEPIVAATHTITPYGRPYMRIVGTGVRA